MQVKYHVIVVGYTPINGYELYLSNGEVDNKETAFKSEALKFKCETSAKIHAKRVGLNSKKIIIKEVTC